jgi:hypothetical protein
LPIGFDDFDRLPGAWEVVDIAPGLSDKDIFLKALTAWEGELVAI